MEIRCENCGCPNQFGTVFCRNCGKKLKVQDLAAMSRKSGSTQKVFKRIFQVIVTLVVIGALCGLFLPVGFKKMPVFEGDEKELGRTIKSLRNAISRGQSRTYTFTPEEMVKVIDTIGEEDRKAYRARPNKKNSDPEIPDPEGKWGLVINEDGTLTAIYEKDFAAAVPFRMTLTGEPMLKKGGATLKAKSSKAGHLPIPDSWLPDVQAKFLEYFKERIDGKYVDAIEEVKIKDGKISIRIKKKEGADNVFGGGGFKGGSNFGSKFDNNSGFGGKELKTGGSFGQ